jgi:hypothetical protein
LSSNHSVPTSSHRWVASLVMITRSLALEPASTKARTREVWRSTGPQGHARRLSADGAFHTERVANGLQIYGCLRPSKKEGASSPPSTSSLLFPASGLFSDLYQIGASRTRTKAPHAHVRTESASGRTRGGSCLRDGGGISSLQVHFGARGGR